MPSSPAASAPNSGMPTTPHHAPAARRAGEQQHREREGSGRRVRDPGPQRAAGQQGSDGRAVGSERGAERRRLHRGDAGLQRRDRAGALVGRELHGGEGHPLIFEHAFDARNTAVTRARYAAVVIPADRRPNR